MKAGTKALMRLVALICIALAVACSSYAPEPKFGAGLSTNLPGGTVASLQGSIFIDPQNVSTCASDSNLTCSLSTCGTTGDGPCKTYGQIVQRWGTNAPHIRTATTITFLSSHSDDTDPIILKASVEHGAQLKIACPIGTAQQVGTGTLSSFVAKNTATPQLTQAALGFTALANQLVDNTTHAGRAWTYSNVSGTTWTYTQPLTVNTYTLGASEVTTWAASDVIAVYEPIAIDLVDLEPVVADATSANELVKVQDCTILDPAGVGQDSLRVNDYVALSEVKSQRGVTFVSPIVAPFSTFSTVVMPGLYNSVTLASNIGSGFPGQGDNSSVAIVGGADLVAAANGSYWNWPAIDSDAIFKNGVTVKNGYVENGVYIGTGATLSAEGFGFENGPAWGPGTISFAGTLKNFYTASNSTAAFKNTGGIEMSGAATTACSSSGATTQTITCGITLNVTNLDAAASGSAFGALAFGKGGSPSVQKGQP